MTTFKAVKIEEIEKKFAVFFYKGYEESWGYMGMRDYPTNEPNGEYEIAVVPYNICGHADSTNAGYVKNSFKTTNVDKEMANRIWWNIKNGISYEELKNGLEKLGLIGMAG